VDISDVASGWSARILIWTVPVVLILVGALGASRITSTFDTRVFLGEDNPRLSVLRDFEATFGRSSTVYLISSYEGRTVLEPPFPMALKDLLSGAETIEYVRRVDSLVNYSIPISAPDDSLLREDLLAFAIQNQDPESLRRQDVLGVLVSPELDVAGTVLTFDLPVGEPGLVRSSYQSLIQLTRRIESVYPGLTVRMTGEIPLMYSFGAAAADDSAILIPLCILVVLVVAAWCLRNAWFVFCLFVAVLVSVAVSLGLFGALGMNFNSTTAILPIVLLVVVMANGLHLLWAIRHQYLGAAHNSPSSVVEPSSYLIPVLISGGTTALGFFMMLGADAPLFRELGLFSGIGTIVGTLLLLAWLPLALRTKGRMRPNVVRTSAESVGSWLYLVGRGKKVRLFLAIGGLALLAGLSMLSVNDNFISYFDDRYPVRGDSDYAAENLGGPNYLEFWIDSGSKLGALDPDFVSRVKRFTDWLRERPETSNVSSVYDNLQDLSLQIGSGDLASMTSEEIAQIVLLYEIGLPLGHRLSERIDYNQQSVRVTALLRIGSSSDIVALEDAAYAKFQSSSEGEHDELVVTGINVPTAYMSYQNTIDMVVSLLGTLLIITVGLGLGYRSWSVFCVSIVAIGLPIALGFGAWGWIFGEIGLASSAIMAITMGIVIDDTVHIVHRFVVLGRSAASSEHLVVGAMRQIAPPIVTTSIMLALGFCVLAFSGFGVNVTLGLCTSVIVVIALFVNLAIVPAVMERSAIRKRSLDTYSVITH